MPNIKSLLLDADIFIYAHQPGIWEALKSKCRVAVPATVVREAQFFKSGREGKKGIDLQRQAQSREIDCLEATAEQVESAIGDFAAAFTEQLHDGEKEALGLLVGRAYQCHYCTGDINAIQAAGMLDLAGSMVSLETVVNVLGLKHNLKRKLPFPLREETLTHHIRTGKERRITRESFKS